MQKTFLYPQPLQGSMTFNKQMQKVIHLAQQEQFSHPFTLKLDGWYANKAYQSNVQIHQIYIWIDHSSKAVNYLYLLSTPEIKGYALIYLPSLFLHPLYLINSIPKE